MKRSYAGLFVLLIAMALPATALAASSTAVAGSMLVHGQIVVATDGSVQSYTLDHRDRLPGYVTKLLDSNISAWRFEPVQRDGTPVVAKARMSIRLVAQRKNDGNYAVRIIGQWFGSHKADASPSQSVRYKDRRKPQYPLKALKQHVAGTVYVVARINRQGNVDKAAVEQVNLRTQGTPARMRRWRLLLADSALSAARNSTYEIPTTGPEMHKSHWTVRYTVDYTLGDEDHAYGQWVAFIPGPQHEIGWLDADDRMAGSANAMPSGALQMASVNRLQLLGQPGS